MTILDYFTASQSRMATHAAPVPRGGTGTRGALPKGQRETEGLPREGGF
jgi:hypothetical protein